MRMENRAVTFPQMYGKSSEQADMPSAPSQNASERELHVIIVNVPSKQKGAKCVYIGVRAQLFLDDGRG